MKKVVKFLPVIAAVLGLVAVISLFLPAIVLESGDKFPGFTTAFGYKKDTPIGKMPMLGFSFMNLLTYILVIVGIVGAVLTYLGKGGSLVGWIATVCLFVAGIFFFCVQSFATVKYEVLKAVWSLGFGAILAGICSILGSLSLAASKLLNK